MFIGLALVCSSAQAEQYIWLKNYWKADRFIHIENGAPAAGRIKPGWYSAQRVAEAVPGTSFKRLRNRWKPEQYVHIENGTLETGSILPGWHSAQWTILTPPGVKGRYCIGNRWKSER